MEGFVCAQPVGVGKATHAENHREETRRQGVGGGMALGLFSLNCMNSWIASVRRILPKNSTKLMSPLNGVMGFEVPRK
jgi:hypothetical protein